MALRFGFDVVSTTSFCKFLRAGSQAAGKERKGVGGAVESGSAGGAAAGSNTAEQREAEKRSSSAVGGNILPRACRLWKWNV